MNIMTKIKAVLKNTLYSNNEIIRFFENSFVELYLYSTKRLLIVSATTVRCVPFLKDLTNCFFL